MTIGGVTCEQGADFSAGMVCSVKEHLSSNPARWTVTVVPKQGKAA
jgi:hypothetical protein